MSPYTSAEHTVPTMVLATQDSVATPAEPAGAEPVGTFEAEQSAAATAACINTATAAPILGILRWVHNL